MYSGQMCKIAGVYALLKSVGRKNTESSFEEGSDREGTQIKENKTMTLNDRDCRAGGRVDSAITVTIRSAGGVNEGAETLKAEEGLRCAPW